jgi:hypothetical protein
MYFNNECAESVFNVKLNKFLRTDGFLMEIFTTFDQFIKFTADVTGGWNSVYIYINNLFL